MQACNYPNLQLRQACTHPSLWPAPPEFTGCQTCTHQIYSLYRPAPTRVYSLHHPNLQAARPASTKSTGCAGLHPPKSTACTTQIYSLHPPNLQAVQAYSLPKSVGWLVQMGEKSRNALSGKCAKWEMR